MEFQRGFESSKTKKSVIVISERSNSFSYLMTLFDNEKGNKVDNGDKTKKDKITFTKIDQESIKINKVNNGDKTKKDKTSFTKIDQEPITNNKVNNGDKTKKDKITFTKIYHFPCDQQQNKVNKVDDNYLKIEIISETNLPPYMSKTPSMYFKESFNRFSKEIEALSPLDGSLVPVLNTVAKKIKKKESERMFDYKQTRNFWNNV